MWTTSQPGGIGGEAVKREAFFFEVMSVARRGKLLNINAQFIFEHANEITSPARTFTEQGLPIIDTYRRRQFALSHDCDHAHSRALKNQCNGSMRNYGHCGDLAGYVGLPTFKKVRHDYKKFSAGGRKGLLNHQRGLAWVLLVA